MAAAARRDGVHGFAGMRPSAVLCCVTSRRKASSQLTNRNSCHDRPKPRDNSPSEGKTNRPLDERQPMHRHHFNEAGRATV